jgi:hypothetical protein
MMRSRRLIVTIATFVLAACGVSSIFRPYEYEEETYLSLDGSATLYVSASVPALNALRGSAFDTNPDVGPEKSAVAAFFSTPATRVRRVTFSKRNGRRYLHVRLDVDDVRRLGATTPFGWSSYAFAQDGALLVYRQRIGAAAEIRSAGTSWTGDEMVAFRVHIPSRVPYHNAGANNLMRGNILVWEQRLADRLAGRPLELDARMETQSILYRTIAVFGGSILVAAFSVGLVLWWIVRKSRQIPAHPQSEAGHARQAPH